MASKNILYHPLIPKNLIILIFNLYLIPSIKANLSFKYPTAFTLNNGNIFVIHSLGIDICDSNYTTSTNILTFTQEMTKEKLSKISISKYSTGEILIFIINKFYLFNEEGTKLIESVTLNSIYGEYYTLKAHKKEKKHETDYYYFLFAYINIYDNSNYNFQIYYYNIKTSDNEIRETAYKIFSDNVKYTGLSCEFTSYNNKEYIMCIYEIDSYEKFPFFIHFLEIKQVSTPASIKSVYYSSFDIPEVKCIQSTIKSIDMKPFFCAVKENGVPFCFMYSLIDLYDISSTFSYIYNNGVACIKQPYNLKTYYFHETSEYIFSCLTEDYKIYTMIFNGNTNNSLEIENLKKVEKKPGCGEFYYYSIIYSKYYNSYIIISDMDCDSGTKFIPLIEEDSEESIIEEEEN